MTAAAFGLVLAAAVMHAVWNLLVKRAGGGAPFAFVCHSVSAVIYLPVLLWVVIVDRPAIGWLELAVIIASAALHLAYILTLQHGYRVGDLSVVYPLARGTGPMLSTAAAILLLGERPSPIQLAGAALVIIGVFVLAASGQRSTNSGQPRLAILFGIATGVLIAAYTVLDKFAVSALLIPPLALDWGGNFGRVALLTPVALAQRAQVSASWRRNWRAAIAVGILAPLGYILVLTALVWAPVSVVAPARELSILFGALLGSRFLAEGDLGRRLFAAGGMAVGVLALALGQG